MQSLKKQIKGREFRFFFLLLYFLILVGFVTGSLIFWGPVRWNIVALQTSGFSQSAEALMIKGYIALISIISVVLAFSLTVRFYEAEGPRKVIIAFVPLLLFIGVLMVWSNPNFAPGRGMKSDIINVGESTFTFGPLPNEDQLRELKNENYTGIISLLHPAIIPFEPKIMADEAAMAKEIGIELISAPMMPWVSDNKESIELIKKIAKTHRGKYYVHCYLGKDRVNVVKRLLESLNIVVNVDHIVTARTLNGMKAFEKGPIIYVGNDVFLIPHPSKEEFFGYLLSGYVKTIVSFIDESIASNSQTIKSDREIFKTYNMKNAEYSFNLSSYNPIYLRSVLDSIAHLPKPLVIILDSTNSKLVETLAKGLRSKNIFLSVEKIEKIMGAGTVKQLYDNVLVGSNPDKNQINKLYENGIMNIIYFSKKPQNTTRETPVAVKEFFIDDNRGLDSLLDGKSWYLCGASTERIKKSFTNLKVK